MEGSILGLGVSEALGLTLSCLGERIDSSADLLPLEPHVVDDGVLRELLGVEALGSGGTA